MPAPYGTFNKSTRNFQQPNTKALELFIAQLVTDAKNASSNTLLSGAYVTPFYNYPSQQELKASGLPTQCIITTQHDQDTQALYPDPSISQGKVLPYWVRPYQINATIKNINNAETVIDLRDELIDLLCFNEGEYTNDGSSTETYKNRPQHNTLLEERIIHEEATATRPSHYYVTLTILFTIYQ